MNYAQNKPDKFQLTSDELQKKIDEYISGGGQVKNVPNYKDQNVSIKDIVAIHGVSSSWVHKQINDKNFVLALNERAPNGNLPPMDELRFSRKEVDQWFFRKGQKHRSL